jgi:hypothetical protein
MGAKYGPIGVKIKSFEIIHLSVRDGERNGREEEKFFPNRTPEKEKFFLPGDRSSRFSPRVL